jgi:hypothetical protein
MGVKVNICPATRTIWNQISKCTSVPSDPRNGRRYKAISAGTLIDEFGFVHNYLSFGSGIVENTRNEHCRDPHAHQFRYFRLLVFFLLALYSKSYLMQLETSKS